MLYNYVDKVKEEIIKTWIAKYRPRCVPVSPLAKDVKVAAAVRYLPTLPVTPRPSRL